jgi:hypothetical protein
LEDDRILPLLRLRDALAFGMLVHEACHPQLTSTLGTM